MSLKGFYKTDLNKFKVPKIGIGMLGYGFMGKAHTNAFKKITYMSWSGLPPAIPDLIAICGRTENKVEEAAFKFGYKGFYTDWREAVKDPQIEIVDNCFPDNMHCEPSIAAAKEGKHIICEKPLAMTLKDAERMLLAVKEAGVKHMCAYNYRFIPAVRLAKEIIEKGYMGNIYEFRGRYLQHYGADPLTPIENVWYATGTRSGVLLGIGSHVIDMARFLIGEISTVFGIQKVFNKSRPNNSGKYIDVVVDESNTVVIEFENGAVGTIEASCINAGRKNQHTWEIYGSKGSMFWDLEDLNNLYVNLMNSSVKEISGFTKVNVTDPNHPFSDMLWPPGHLMGWESGQVNEIFHFVDAVVNNKPVEPYGATFYDGYMVQLIMDSVNKSNMSGKKIKIKTEI